MERFGKNIKPKGKKNTVTPKFKKLVREFMNKHKDVLRELAKR